MLFYSDDGIHVSWNSRSTWWILLCRWCSTEKIQRYAKACCFSVMFTTFTHAQVIHSFFTITQYGFICVLFYAQKLQGVIASQLWYLEKINIRDILIPWCCQANGFFLRYRHNEVVNPQVKTGISVWYEYVRTWCFQHELVCYFSTNHYFLAY